MAYCERCDRSFQYWSSYQQHIANSSNHHICDDCDKDFDSWDALKQHYIQSPRHHYCRECDTHFPNNASLIRHCLDDHFYCDDCDRFFRSAHGLQQHNRQSHIYCVECQCFFSSESNLREHLNSSAHRPKDIPCAFQNRGCAQWFTSRSAMISHLEYGSCSSRVNRRMIDEYVRRYDRKHVITDPSRLLTDGEDRRYIATDRSWNGSAWECVLCYKIFGSLDALNRHLASPRHQDKIYRCPLETCQKTFTTLSALCRHVESESCGVIRFRVVREAMDRIFDSTRRLRITGE